MITFTIPGTLPSLNNYIDACRRNRYAAAKMKSDTEDKIIWAIRQQLGNMRITEKVNCIYFWHEPSQRRDPSNIAAGVKFIEDAMIKAGLIQNDGWKNIGGIEHHFLVNKGNPRIEVVLRECV